MSDERASNTSSHATLTDDELRRIDAWWRACNYLSVGMIYLRDNPLLREPLKVEHVKHRLLGHWGASPALSFVWAHMNRVIKRDDLDVIFMAGPGHGAPGVLGPAYLEGTYSEVYPDKSEDAEGMQKFFKQFSFPGHIGSHVTPETPGSIHEGGELGYSLSHAYGAALDNPDLIVACVVGDGEAETGPLATAWHSNKFINLAHRLHLEQIHHVHEAQPQFGQTLAQDSRDFRVGVAVLSGSLSAQCSARLHGSN
ncbi:phosphoketolase [Paraburkholderia kirstenboschensis]|nr:phosphoketolase [Paraburkholderia kirstenboschensis]